MCCILPGVGFVWRSSVELNFVKTGLNLGWTCNFFSHELCLYITRSNQPSLVSRLPLAQEPGNEAIQPTLYHQYSTCTQQHSKHYLLTQKCVMRHTTRSEWAQAFCANFVLQATNVQGLGARLKFRPVSSRLFLCTLGCIWLAAATNQGWCLFHSELPNMWLLIEGGNYSSTVFVWRNQYLTISKSARR